MLGLQTDTGPKSLCLLTFIIFYMAWWTTVAFCISRDQHLYGALGSPSVFPVYSLLINGHNCPWGRCGLRVLLFTCHLLWICSGCHNKVPHSRWLKNKNWFLTVLEAGSTRSRFGQLWFLLGLLSFLLVPCHGLASVHSHPCASSFS